MTLFFILGLHVGSFLHVVGLRIPKKQPFVCDRSMCPQCEHVLSWYELIPVVSFILQKGRCRYCLTSIPLIYPVLEIITGLLFALSYALIGLNLEFLIAILLIAMLIIVLITDIQYMLIPDRILLFFLLLFAVCRFFQPLDPWWSSIAGFFVALVLIAVIIVVSHGGMGGGDMKLFAVLGLVLGVKKVILTFFLACMVGAVCSVFILLYKQTDRKRPVPFGPYIAIAAIVAYFYGESILHWYFQFFI